MSVSGNTSRSHVFSPLHDRFSVYYRCLANSYLDVVSSWHYLSKLDKPDNINYRNDIIKSIRKISNPSKREYHSSSKNGIQPSVFLFLEDNTRKIETKLNKNNFIIPEGEITQENLPLRISNYLKTIKLILNFGFGILSL